MSTNLTSENPATIECNGIRITRGENSQFSVSFLRDGIAMMILDSFILNPHDSQTVEDLEISLPVRLSPT